MELKKIDYFLCFYNYICLCKDGRYMDLGIY